MNNLNFYAQPQHILSTLKHKPMYSWAMCMWPPLHVRTTVIHVTFHICVQYSYEYTLCNMRENKISVAMTLVPRHCNIINRAEWKKLKPEVLKGGHKPYQRPDITTVFGIKNRQFVLCKIDKKRRWPKTTSWFVASLYSSLVKIVLEYFLRAYFFLPELVGTNICQLLQWSVSFEHTTGEILSHSAGRCTTPRCVKY